MNNTRLNYSSGYMGGNGSHFGEDYFRQLMEFDKYYYIMCTFVFGPLILLGLVGNIISFFTWGKVKSQNAITFLLRTLAVFDSFLLLVMILPVYTAMIQFGNHVDGWLYTVAEMLWPYTCVFIFPLINISTFAIAWTTACIGMNRYIAVCRGLHAVRLCTVSRAKKQIICIIIVSIFFNLPRFFECKIGEEPDGSKYPECSLKHNEWFTYIYMLGCDTIGIFLIPFCMLLFSCVRITLSLRAARRHPINRHGERPDTRTTSMLLILLGIFLVCHTYWGIFTFLAVLLPDNDYITEYLVLIFWSSLTHPWTCWYISCIYEFRKILRKKIVAIIRGRSAMADDLT